MLKIGLNFTYLSEKHAGGKDQVGLNLLRGFYELGLMDQFVVICFEYSKDMILQIAPGVCVITIKNPKVSSELQRMILLSLIGSFIIPKVVKKHNISLIYHLSCNNGFRKLKVPSVVIPHDIKAVSHRVLSSVKVPFYKYYLCKAMYYMDFKIADSIIAISEFDKYEISTFYHKFDKKIKRIYHPIVIKHFPDRNKPSRPYLCALNLQFHHKNIISLIKAFEQIMHLIPHDLVLIGSVPQRMKYLKDYVTENKLSERVFFKGFLPDKEIYSLLANCDLYVNPSLFEGFGMTSVEAMILGAPTLVSMIPANVEVTQQLAHYYMPADDIHELAKQIMVCLKNPGSKEKLQSISQKLRDIYDCGTICKQYYGHFQSLLNQYEINTKIIK